MAASKQGKELKDSPPLAGVSYYSAKRAERLKDFAASLGVSYDSVFRAARAGKLKTVRFGKSILVPAEEAERVMREGL